MEVAPPAIAWMVIPQADIHDLYTRLLLLPDQPVGAAVEHERLTWQYYLQYCLA
jgi:hypothetical protein